MISDRIKQLLDSLRAGKDVLDYDDHVSMLMLLGEHFTNISLDPNNFRWGKSGTIYKSWRISDGILCPTWNNFREFIIRVDTRNITLTRNGYGILFMCNPDGPTCVIIDGNGDVIDVHFYSGYETRCDVCAYVNCRLFMGDDARRVELILKYS